MDAREERGAAGARAWEPWTRGRRREEPWELVLGSHGCRRGEEPWTRGRSSCAGAAASSVVGGRCRRGGELRLLRGRLRELRRGGRAPPWEPPAAGPRPASPCLPRRSVRGRRRGLMSRARSSVRGERGMGRVMDDMWGPFSIFFSKAIPAQPNNFWLSQSPYLMVAFSTATTHNYFSKSQSSIKHTLRNKVVICIG